MNGRSTKRVDDTKVSESRRHFQRLWGVFCREQIGCWVKVSALFGGVLVVELFCWMNQQGSLEGGDDFLS